MQQRHRILLAAFTTLAVMHAAAAGDLRAVTRPTTPQTCASLTATGEDDSQAIQKALESCAKGKAVALSSGTFKSGPVNIPSGVSLLVDDNVTLQAIPTPALYDRGNKTCGTVDKFGDGCKAFITMDGVEGSGIYGEGTIDGQGGMHMTGTNESWWRLIKRAIYLDDLPNNPNLIHIGNSSDITMYQVTLKNSPLTHVSVRDSNSFTAWKITINSPKATSETDGVRIDGSQNITIAHSKLHLTTDTVHIKASSSPSRHISIYNNHFNRGGGLDIGENVAYGVSNVKFYNQTLNNLRFGLYIRTNTLNGGLVSNIAYDNVCMHNVRWPFSLDMLNSNRTGNQNPQIKNVTLNNVWVGTKGHYIFHGRNESDPIKVKMNNVHYTRGSPWSVVGAQVTGNWIDDINNRHCRYTDSEWED